MVYQATLQVVYG